MATLTYQQLSDDEVRKIQFGVALQAVADAEQARLASVAGSASPVVEQAGDLQTKMEEAVTAFDPDEAESAAFDKAREQVRQGACKAAEEEHVRMVARGEDSKVVDDQVTMIEALRKEI